MSDRASQRSEDRQPPPRCFAATGARVMRDTDAMRLGIDAAVFAISTDGVGIRIGTQLGIGEIVQIELKHDLQRIKREVRGIVRSIEPAFRERFDVTIEFQMRLTPLEVSLLKSSYDADGWDDTRRWI